MDDELKRYYRENLGPRIEALESAAAALPDPVCAEVARRVAHTLKGSGGTYGFPQVTEAAARAEDASDAELGAAIAELVEVLRRVSVGATGADVDRRGVTLLLVDDDPMILLLGARVLEGAGWVVRTAASAQAALEHARREVPDALLLDLFLGDVDGDELLARLRQVPGLADVPAAFLTGQREVAEVERLRALGVRGVIGKPFDPETLPEQVQRLLAPA